MSEQTEFSLSQPPKANPPESPGAESPPLIRETPEAPKPKRRPRKVAAKDDAGQIPAEEKPADVVEKPKKRATTRKKKADSSPAETEQEKAAPEVADATGVGKKPTPVRKRTTRTKTAAEPDAAPPAAEPSAPAASPATSQVEASASPQPRQAPAQEPAQSENLGTAAPEGGTPAPAQEGASQQDNDSYDGKRGRRFRNRRRGRDRFQRREEFQGNGENGHTSNPAPEQPAEDAEPVFEEGLVDVSGKGFGFLRKAEVNFDPSHTDTFITPDVVRIYNLRDGMWIKGQVRQGHRGPQLFKLVELEGEDPEQYKNLPVFEELTVINPLERIRLETGPQRFTTRVIDLMAPIGKGTRGLLVAPPRTGKTTILQHIAEALAINHPDIKVIMLLVDERPEEVTELRRALPHAEVIASSNDSDIKSHTRIAQLGIDRAKRLVEMGKDVFVLMDSITRIGRAFNNAQSGKGRTMSGGVDSRALEIPRKLFAAARNTEEAGSLTIIGTALVETGSKMDDLIFLEFKGTGNMELVLDRKISDQRIYPAADIFMSGTRREELLIPADNLHKINIIRRGLAGHKPFEAIERLLFFLQKYPTNQEMLAGIPG